MVEKITYIDDMIADLIEQDKINALNFYAKMLHDNCVREGDCKKCPFANKKNRAICNIDSRPKYYKNLEGDKI